ncbi:hypothetical protein CEXT_44281, partial [Caerostris extrusa]
MYCCVASIDLFEVVARETNTYTCNATPHPSRVLVNRQLLFNERPHDGSKE